MNQQCSTEDSSKSFKRTMGRPPTSVDAHIHIAYPQAVAMIPLPQVWAVCFFVMVMLLCLDTEFVAVETIITSVTDIFPRVLRRPRHRGLILPVFCLFCFMMQLIMVTEGGMYWFQLFDYYACSGACVLFPSVFQTLAIGWIFGAERLCDIIEDMTGSYPNVIFRVCWKYITPLISLVTLIYYLVDLKPLTYNREYLYPGWAHGLGWMLALSSILMVPGWAMGCLWSAKGSFRQRWLYLVSPDRSLPLKTKGRNSGSDLICADGSNVNSNVKKNKKANNSLNVIFSSYKSFLRYWVSG